MKTNKEIPFNKGLPLLGNLLAYHKDRLVLLSTLRDQLGGSFRIKIGPKVLTVLTSPEDVQVVMRTNMKNYYKKTNFDQLFGEGIFTANDSQWKIQRKMIQPLFGPRFIESCSKIISDKTEQAIDLYTTTHGTNQADVYELFSKATFEIIIATIIGIDYSKDFHELNYSLNFISDYLTKSNYLPFELPIWMNSSKKEYTKCKAFLDKTIFESINSQKLKTEQDGSNMISLMLKAKNEIVGMDLDEQKIRDNIISLLFAGFETSALTLSWISCILAKHPNVQHKLFEEIKSFNSNDFKIKDLEQLPYLDAVVNETMRLYPAGWAWSRLAKDEDEINGLKIGKDEIILISPFLTQRSETVWDQADKFQPERFLNEVPATKKPFAFFPFGGGPRICVGKQFALISMKLILIQTLKSYEFTASKLPTPSALATLQSNEGFRLSMRKRK